MSLCTVSIPIITADLVIRNGSLNWSWHLCHCVSSGKSFLGLQAYLTYLVSVESFSVSASDYTCNKQICVVRWVKLSSRAAMFI